MQITKSTYDLYINLIKNCEGNLLKSPKFPKPVFITIKNISIAMDVDIDIAKQLVEWDTDEGYLKLDTTARPEKYTEQPYQRVSNKKRVFSYRYKNTRD